MVPVYLLLQRTCSVCLLYVHESVSEKRIKLQHSMCASLHTICLSLSVASKVRTINVVSFFQKLVSRIEEDIDCTMYGQAAARR